MKKQARRTMANIGVVLATVGVLALGLFFTYTVIAWVKKRENYYA